ncbi:MAG: hypothetical protein IIB90_05750 [Gemmatimonadetes bacterium]|nr:hypothetical protein [Gemmatimonadota bacterium]
MTITLPRGEEPSFPLQRAELGERRASAQLGRRNPGSGFIAHDLLREAMDCYERAEKTRPSGNDDAILRWNTCARFIMEEEHIRPKPEDDFEPVLE